MKKIANGKIKWIVIFFFLFSNIAFSQAHKIQRQPKLQLSESFWDFGYLPDDVEVSHLFLIKNVGDDSLFITNVRASCGCTYAPISKSRLGPGETTDLEVVFNSRKFRGETQKAIYVSTNDTSSLSSYVTVSAKIGLLNPLVATYPEKVIFGSFPEVKKIWVKNIANSKIFLSTIYAPLEFIDFSIQKQSLDPQDSTQVTLSLKKPLEKPQLKTSITFGVEGPEKVHCTIPIELIKK
jgi:hypothetical protein